MEETKDDDDDAGSSAGGNSCAENKLGDFGAIPELKSKKNAAASRQAMPFSYRLFNGSIKIDPKDVHAVANQMLFEINLMAG